MAKSHQFATLETKSKIQDFLSTFQTFNIKTEDSTQQR